MKLFALSFVVDLILLFLLISVTMEIGLYFGFKQSEFSGFSLYDLGIITGVIGSQFLDSSSKFFKKFENK